MTRDIQSVQMHTDESGSDVCAHGITDDVLFKLHVHSPFICRLSEHHSIIIKS